MDDTQQFYEALESIVESKHWRWMSGMRTDTGWLVVDPMRSARGLSLPGSMMVMVKGERMALSAAYRLPDVEDPATQGCMIQILSECINALGFNVKGTAHNTRSTAHYNHCLGREAVSSRRRWLARWLRMRPRSIFRSRFGEFGASLAIKLADIFEFMAAKGVQLNDTEKEREQAQEAQ